MEVELLLRMPIDQILRDQLYCPKNFLTIRFLTARARRGLLEEARLGRRAFRSLIFLVTQLVSQRWLLGEEELVGSGDRRCACFPNCSARG